MWKKIRLIVAVLSLICCTLLFCDLSEKGHIADFLAFLAEIQLIPALLWGSFGILVVILATTFVYGRIYCSAVCPLGLLQDLLISLKTKRIFRHLPALSFLRYGILLIFIVGLLLGIPFIVAFLDPYSTFGRIATNVVKPIVVLINNGLEWLFSGETTFFTQTPLVFQQSYAFIIALAVFIFLFVVSLLFGRFWCSSLCPVGTFLGCIAKYALYRPRIDQQSCIHCGKCEHICKANCIDAKTGTIDASRCIACFNCQGICAQDALTFTAPSKSHDPSRRQTLVKLFAIATCFAGSKNAFAETNEAELLARSAKKQRFHSIPILPAGAQNLKHFTSHCTGCQLCVANCPSKTLRVSELTSGLLQPSLGYENGFCLPECTLCSQLCPTNALSSITKKEKAAIQVGFASIDTTLCIVNKDGVVCTLCQRNCPTEAITLVGDTDPKHPVVDAEKCIGCGACEFYCPARPLSAITITAYEQHKIRSIKKV